MNRKICSDFSSIGNIVLSEQPLRFFFCNNRINAGKKFHFHDLADDAVDADDDKEDAVDEPTKKH